MNINKKEFIPETSVTFKTDDLFLLKLFNISEEKALANIRQFDKYKVMVEGAEYPNVWIETQPMAGEMYAKRDLEAAKANQEIFMDLQRADGRFPGMIKPDLFADFRMFQGYCFPTPAYKLYFLLNKDKFYLEKLYHALEKYDEYLWRERDTDKNGCLEVFCRWDTGEDHSVRFHEGSPNGWEDSTPPDQGNVPFESMDAMAYSYDGRNTLAKISKILNNGKEAYWRTKAEEVRNKVMEYLWIPEKHACYDRDRNNEVMDVLLHNNIRLMYHGLFTQQMADEFVKYHLLNPEEFWTAMPLPSIAVNDPMFRNTSRNNWSGQPQALTYQRAIRALENYGYYSIVTELGHKLINKIGESHMFCQQFDPFTGEQNGKDGYGPAIMAVLEYIAHMYGIHLDEDEIWWSGLRRGDFELSYIQRWNNNNYRIENKNGLFKGYINDIEMFESATGVRVITDLKGNIKKTVGIDTEPHSNQS